MKIGDNWVSLNALQTFQEQDEVAADDTKEACLHALSSTGGSNRRKRQRSCTYGIQTKVS